AIRHEPQFDLHSGYGVLLDALERQEKAVNDVVRANAQPYRSAFGKVQLIDRNDVIGISRVGFVDAEWICRRDQHCVRLAENAVCSGIPEIPDELLAHDLDNRGPRRRQPPRLEPLAFAESVDSDVDAEDDDSCDESETFFQAGPDPIS